ncbi:protein RICE SALT SENSITIVE 3-like isoform X2 [Nymphaea colorata]|uniref:protein RICE SALT SENSITIVE 3-like isoform X2 n=1 Tax=Nymphaea colorata TaxID=210225 RepID=UPI00129E4F25|nr:protein RICE SALT SENSITIVE 3-like isoform X2 [Nymphaea colorata]
MEESLTHGMPLAVTHLLQHTLRSLCVHDNSQWVYAVFWRILPRNYPPPKWDFQGGPYDRSRGNRRNWILVWEDGFCNFAASMAGSGNPMESTLYIKTEPQMKGLQPELFFKMSHEIYNYGEGLIGKVASDHGHKWIFKEPNDQDINFVSAWNNPVDSQPRTWEAQFQSGIQTIALVAVREGVLQLGAVNKNEGCPFVPDNNWPIPASPTTPMTISHADQYADYLTLVSNLHDHDQLKITPSMTSLEALLSKLPSVEPAPSGRVANYGPSSQYVSASLVGKAKMEEDDDFCPSSELGFGGGSSSSMCSFHQR